MRPVVLIWLEAVPSRFAAWRASSLMRKAQRALARYDWWHALAERLGR